MQGPEVDPDLAIDGQREDHSCQEVAGPCDDEVDADAVAPSYPSDGTLQTDQRRHQSEHGGDRAQPAVAHQVERVQHGEHDEHAGKQLQRKACTRMQVVGEHRFDEQGQRGGDHQQREPRHVHFDPRLVGPQVDRTQAEQMQVEQQVAEDHRCVLRVHGVLEVDPLLQAEDQQAQADRDQETLQQDLVIGVRVERRRRQEFHRHDHRAARIDVEQEVDGLAARQIQHRRRRARAQRPIAERHQAAHRRDRFGAAVSGNEDLDAIQQRVVDFQHPAAVRIDRDRYRYVKPHRIIAESHARMR